MRKRVTAVAGASLFATAGLLGAYVGYPGLRRAHATTPCGTVNSEASLDAALLDVNAGTCNYIYIQSGYITLYGNSLQSVLQSSSVTITGAGQDFTTLNVNAFRGFNFTGTGDINISNLTIKNGYSGSNGGAISNINGNITITSSTFENNAASAGNGGAIYNRNGAITITGSTFTGNSATGNSSAGKGAAVWAGKGVVVTDSEFSGNTATGFGGAIHNNDRDITISGSTFENNSTNIDGGAISNEGNYITITGSTFRGNTATSDGGAIFSFSGNSITITGSTFENNTATNDDGGAIWNYGGDITITGSYFTTNTATGGIGGAIYNEGSDITITGGTLGNNQGFRGGAVYNDRGDITITSSYFTTNRATGLEGGAVRSGGSTAIEGSTFTDNSAIEAGGAIWSEEGASITDSTFDQNVAGSGYSGGAVFVDYLEVSASVDVVNSTFTDNTADAGSALYVNRDDGTGTLNMNFSTVTGNTARTAGGAAVEAAGSTDFEITNSILYNNLSSGTPAELDVATNGNLDLAFSLLTSNASFSPAGPTTPDVLFGDPLLGALANNGGDTRTMLPSADSPVIGMANPTGAPAFDQRGFTRTTNGLADMGSVERGGTPPEPDLSQLPPSWFQAQQRREQSATCPPGMVPSWAQWPNEQTGGWTCEWTTWWDVNKGSTGGWVTTPGFTPGVRRPE